MFRNIGNRIGLGDQLANNPSLALDPEIAAEILAAFFKDRGVADSASQGDFVTARRGVNGVDMAQQIANRAQQYRQAIGG